MTSLKARDLQNETTEELRERESALRKELYELRIQAHSSRVEKPHRIKEIRRNMARLLTVLKEKGNAAK